MNSNIARMERPKMLEEIAFAWVAESADSKALFPEETKLVAKSTASKKLAFARGRLAAHQCMRELDLPVREIGRDQYRAPIWPAGYIGSISHCSDAACAILASTIHARLLGLDIERLDRKFDSKIAKRICCDSEREWLESNPDFLAPPLLMIFCAKESIYKALHPHVKRAIGFKEVELSALPSQTEFKAGLGQQLVTDLDGLDSLTLYFSSDATHLLSYVFK